MKKIFKSALLTAAAMGILFTGCNKETADAPTETIPENVKMMETHPETVSETTSETVSETTAETSAVPESNANNLAAQYGLTEDNFPVIDGSTSAIPIESGLRAMLFDIPQEEAEMQVKHTKTHTAFTKLLDGECDMILSVPLSADQKKAAEEKGIEIEMVPVSAEGFTFVVNTENPVDNLTQDQIRKIYSGEITNWSEVGGNDADIIPYQRNTDSGSQNYMIEFMGDTPLMEAKTELINFGMGGILDSIAVYDNSVDAIGYTVYTYAINMYENYDDIKALKIDGIEISADTLSDGTYPLLSVTYCMFRADEPEDSPVRKFVEFLGSEEAKTAITNSGYVPVS
ncbi:MAG: substrate-binding domain-containing protein [Oscillospiraceae bacterium]|nr:substrate-binding domain-containing protein [Oscillospiraceae bacterium]